MNEPGLIGVIAQDTARFTLFAASLMGVATPPGTQVDWQIGHSIAANENALVRSMLDTDAGWLWILGDDHVFAPDLLLRLLGHGADIAVPLCLTRTPPYKPVVFSGWEDGLRRRIDLDSYPDGGLAEIHSAGSGGMLVRRRVFEGLADPWFEAGVADPQGLGEDVYLCDKAREAGYSLVCDLDAPLGHLTTGTVWPVQTAEGWTYGFTMSGGLELTLPVGFNAGVSGVLV